VEGRPYRDPFSKRELLDGTFRTLRRHLKSLWFFSFLGSLPFALWFNWWDTKQMFSPSDVPDTEVITYQVAEILVLLLFLYPFLQNAIYQSIQNRKAGVRFLFRAAWRNGIRVWLAQSIICLFYLLLFILILGFIGVPVAFLSKTSAGKDADFIMIAFSVSLLLACLPGLYLFAKFSFVIPFIHEEEVTAWGAVKRSWSFTKGSAGMIALHLFILTLISSIPYLVPMEVYGFTVISPPDWLLMAIVYGYQLIIAPFLYPVIPIYLTLVYLNERLKKEGHDILNHL
jgi:membrane-anchored glycerophosphoryl diester phosphodiesterase (GDPDase)